MKKPAMALLAALATWTAIAAPAKQQMQYGEPQPKAVMGGELPVNGVQEVPVIYTSENDGNSSQAKAWLVANGIRFAERPIERDANLKAFWAKGGKATPFVTYRGKSVTGFSNQDYRILFYGK